MRLSACARVPFIPPYDAVTQCGRSIGYAAYHCPCIFSMFDDYFLRWTFLSLKYSWRYVGMDVQNGDLVKVRAYGGHIQIRRLLEVRGKTAIISTDEECQTAKREGREPITIGVPLDDVTEIVDPNARP